MASVSLGYQSKIKVMKQTILSFQEIVSLLEAAKLPCTVKQYQYENGSTQYSIEFGFNWPDDLVEAVGKAFGGIVPSYIHLCADSCGPELVARKSIAGGPKRYFDYYSWG